MPQAERAATPSVRLARPRAIDEERVRAAGIRKVAGKRLTLYTDLPPQAEVDALPEVFALAVPQWCETFGVDPSLVADWWMNGFLMKDKQRFLQAGLLPAGLPDFKNGFSIDAELWLYEPTSPYYRRHLFLHEGTHGFLNGVLRWRGPPWYVEGIAELMATHSYRDGKLRLGYFPASPDEVYRLGRIEMVQKALAAGGEMTLPAILDYGYSAHLENQPYAWCWALAAFLDGHPRYGERFTGLTRAVRQPEFSRRFRSLFAADWRELNEEWQVFAATLDYGHDLERTVIDFRPGEPLASGSAERTIQADRGWQNSRLRLEAGVAYKIVAQGRYQIADEPKIWWCEPGGVTVRYNQGRPLGMLLGALRPDDTAAGAQSPLADPLEIGLGTTLRPKQSGTLYLRMNDSTGELHDNAGELTVRVSVTAD